MGKIQRVVLIFFSISKNLWKKSIRQYVKEKENEIKSTDPTYFPARQAV
jgi:hypothetical protein